MILPLRQQRVARMRGQLHYPVQRLAHPDELVRSFIHPGVVTAGKRSEKVSIEIKLQQIPLHREIDAPAQLKASKAK